jgi:signal transduction histidine kinase
VLIGDLLDYANPRPIQPVDFDLGVLVDEVVQVARSDPRFADVDIACEHDAELRVTADPAKLRQVVWNLVRNAGEAAKERDKHVAVAAYIEDATTILHVEDDGPGIADDRLAHIFDPFFTTKPLGTGLGLATSQAMVHEHGGHIDVETEVGRGTIMIVRLPRS